MHTLNTLWCAHNEEVWLRRLNRDLNRQCLETISEMPESLFVQQFRLNKSTFQALCEQLRHKTSLKGTKEIPLKVKVKVLKYILIKYELSKWLFFVHNNYNFLNDCVFVGFVCS